MFGVLPGCVSARALWFLSSLSACGAHPSLSVQSQIKTLVLCPFGQYMTAALYAHSCILLPRRVRPLSWAALSARICQVSLSKLGAYAPGAIFQFAQYTLCAVSACMECSHVAHLACVRVVRPGSTTCLYALSQSLSQSLTLQRALVLFVRLAHGLVTG